MYELKPKIFLFAILVLASAIGAIAQTEAEQDNGWIEGVVSVKGEDGSISKPPKVKGWDNFTGYAHLKQEGKQIGVPDHINMSGVFSFAAVPPGTYSLIVELPAYKVANIRNVEVKTGTPTVLELVLLEKGSGWQESVVATSVVTYEALDDQIETIKLELAELKSMLEELLARE